MIDSRLKRLKFMPWITSSSRLTVNVSRTPWRARASSSNSGKSGDLSHRLSSLLTDLKEQKPETKFLDRLAVKTEGRVLFFKLDDIDWIEAADNYVNIHTGNEQHLHRETMSALEAKLPPNRFIRISRSTIVNIERIKEMQPMFHGDYVVILKNGTRLSLSRNYREKLNHLLGKQ